MTSKSFIGKWTLATPDEKYFITLKDTDTGVLNLEPPASPSNPLSNFNAYGEANSDFWLQGSNWQYITYNVSSKEYQATQPRDGELSVFQLEAVGGSQYRIVEHGSDGKDYYLNVNGSALERIAKQANPPGTTIFLQNAIAEGLEHMQTWGAMGQDLTGVYLAGENLSEIAFSGSDLSYAVLRGAALKDAVFQGATINETDFSDSSLDGVVFSGAKGEGPIFNGVTLADATNFSGATINKAQFQNVTSQGGAIMNNVTADRAVFNGSDLSDLVCNGSTLTNTKFIGVNLSNAQMGDTNFESSVLTQSDFRGASLQRSIFNSATLAMADFSGADCTNAAFQKANMTNVKLSKANGILNIDITGALLVGAILNELDLTTVKIDNQTNFTEAQMESVNLTGQSLDGVNFLQANLKQAKLDSTSFEEAVLVGANLNFTSITGSVSFIGANLSSVSLENADLSGAQMGPLQQVAILSTKDIVALNAGTVPQGLQHKNIFSSQELVKVTVREEGADWLLEEGGRTLFVKKVGEELQVLQEDSSSKGAVLTNAYMPNAKLTGANLYAVDMSGVHWYGSNARADNANLEQANLSNANLSTMNFTQARMYGVNLSFANLIQTNFRKALLTPTQQLKPTSFAFASMQGADFTEAKINSANLTNAAVSLNIESSSGNLAGDYLFSIDGALGSYLDGGTITDEIVRAFSENQYTIAKTDCLTILLLGSMWSIKRASRQGQDYSQFILVSSSEDNNIRVYGDASEDTGTEHTKIPFGAFTAVPLFQMSTTLVETLDKGIISTDLKTAFNDSGYPLEDSACLTVTQQGNRWTINNSDPDPNALQSGYSQFILVKKSEVASDFIMVYGGSPLLVVRTGLDNQLTKVRTAFGPTIFSENVLTNDITCPSGLKYGMLNEGISFEDLMTPGLPPHPPSCIPTPTTWC